METSEELYSFIEEGDEILADLDLAKEFEARKFDGRTETMIKVQEELHDVAFKIIEYDTVEALEVIFEDLEYYRENIDSERADLHAKIDSISD